MPLVSGSGSLLITLTNRDRPLFAAAGLLFMVVSVGLGIVLFVGTRSSARRRQRDNRERYLDYLESMRRTARAAAALQRDRAARRHPEPAALLDLARLPARRWERRRGDLDFLEVRLGTGTTPLARGLSVSVDRTNPLTTYDPVCLAAAEGLVERYAVLGDQPISVRLADLGCLSIVGNRHRGRALARAVIGQLVALHPPDDVRIAVVRALPLAEQWEWVKWLPHNLDGSAVRGPKAETGPAADQLLVCASFTELLARIAGDLDARRADAERRRGKPPGTGHPRLVTILDGELQYGAPRLEVAGGSPADLGIHLINLVGHRREEPEQVDLRITLVPDAAALLEGKTSTAGGGLLPAVDGLTASSVAALARSMAALRLVEDDAVKHISAAVGLRDILGVSDVAELDPRQSWLPGSARDFLRVPVGVGAGGQPVHLDLKESARGGMGPHGLVVGATGSGKSELLRTMVTSLVISHPPERLALLLVDFKGGATFAGFAGLPHVAGMVTNLAADPGLVQRFRDALYGELTRRQRVLAEAGNLPNVHVYADRVSRSLGGDGVEPMPHLLVIIDEFTELLSARPDFAELFLAVGRIGRSIGIHLLLATQRLDAGKIRGLESHLSYRIGLRTFSESESREVLGVPDAYHLPPEPGVGYLKVDTTVFERFKAALISAPYPGPAGQTRSVARVVEFSTIPATVPGTSLADLLEPNDPLTSTVPESTGLGAVAETILDVAVQRLAGAGAPRVRQVWIDPLPPVISLDAVPHGSARGTDETSGPPSAGQVSVVLGLRDIPGEQRQVALTWDFAGPHGNLMVVGGALSGKSVLLRTMICSLALRYPPGEVAVYCLDYGGGSLAALEALPQVAGASTRADPDRVRRTVADVLGMLDGREALLTQHGWDGADGLRGARRSGSLPDTVLGDVFLVIDGWAAFREAEPDLEDHVMAIANRGPSLGVHTVLSASAGSHVRMRLAAALPGRIELRLSDAFDSAIDRRLAESVPADVPGRALVPGGDLVQIALPRIDGARCLDDLPAGVHQVVGEVRQRWPGAGVRSVRVLPTSVTLTDLVDRADAGSRSSRRPGVAVGLSERDLSPVAVDLFSMDPHLQVYGESQSGKSTLLRTLLRQLISTRTPSDLGIVLVDYRRTHLGLVPPEYLLGYCTSAMATRQAVAEVCAGLARRLPGPDVTNEELRARSWWRGPDIVVVVDDYDQVSAASGNPLTPLTEYIAQGRDVGLHLVTARRTGGACRAMFEPVTQALSDLAGPGFLFSGDRTEGRLVNGVASLSLPPGRALLAGRGRPAEQVQIAWTDPTV
ncbi:MAG: type VII secretion protein EccCa [Actinomycetota bacterium]|nr:type VII secretion protein EccCa [Actinomycetota bacterium]